MKQANWRHKKCQEGHDDIDRVSDWVYFRSRNLSNIDIEY